MSLPSSAVLKSGVDWLHWTAKLLEAAGISRSLAVRCRLGMVQLPELALKRSRLLALLVISKRLSSPSLAQLQQLAVAGNGSRRSLCSRWVIPWSKLPWAVARCQPCLHTG